MREKYASQFPPMTNVAGSFWRFVAMHRRLLVRIAGDSINDNMSEAAHATEPLEPVFPYHMGQTDDDSSGYDSDESDDSCREWEEIPLKKVSDLTIDMDTLDKDLLRKVGKEWNDIFEELKKQARVLGYEHVNESNVEKVAIHVYANDYVNLLLKHTNLVTEGALVSRSDVLDFLCQEMCCAFLNSSPTDIFNEEMFDKFVVCDKETYFRVYQALGKNPDQPEPYVASATIKNIEKEITEICRWATRNHTRLLCAGII